MQNNLFQSSRFTFIGQEAFHEWWHLTTSDSLPLGQMKRLLSLFAMHLDRKGQAGATCTVRKASYIKHYCCHIPYSFD